MNKLEMYNSIVRVTVASGQGLAGSIIRRASLETGPLLDELLEDGLIERYVNSTGEWIVPTGCYMVFRDEVRYPNALTFVRLYLGITDLGLGTTPKDFLKNIPFMEKYMLWLRDNEQALIDLVNLKEMDYLSIDLDEKDIKWIKSKDWYEKNLTVTECHSNSEKKLRKNIETININNKILKLCTEGGSKYRDKATEAKDEIEKLKKFNRTRKHINDWLLTQNQSLCIQDLI